MDKKINFWYSIYGLGVCNSKIGSVFKVNGAPKEYYGRLVREVYPAKSEVIQYAYTFTVPIKYPIEVG